MTISRVLGKVRETCRCGAVLDYEGPGPRWAAYEFRRDHEKCRIASPGPKVEVTKLGSGSQRMPGLDAAGIPLNAEVGKSSA